jgi:hypothetical protein
MADREGSAALEHILRKRDCLSSAVPELGLKELIVLACWYMWWERRKIPRDENVQNPARTSQSILALFLNYSRASKKNLGIKHYGWIKPAEDYVKLNIDAAFSVENFLGAVGAIIQNDQGIFLAGCCGTLPHVADAAREKAMALRLGLTLAGEVGCNWIEINNDCMEVVNMM